ncbi:MAG: SH3 domain-containing protein [Flavobacterium sp.]
MNSGNISQDTLKIDVNGDGLKDILLQFDYEYNKINNVPKGNSGHELAIYLNNGQNEYLLKNVNRKALWVIHTSIFGLDNTTFCIVNEEVGQDPNNYYCYFRFDKQRDNWYMIKHQIKTFNTGREVLIEEKIYKYENQLAFEEVSFDKLFGKMHNDVGEPTPLLELIKVSNAIIYNTPNSPTKMYLIKGDEVEILEEKGEWLKIRYYGKKTIEGWIKRSDVE